MSDSKMTILPDGSEPIGKLPTEAFSEAAWKAASEGILAQGVKDERSFVIGALWARLHLKAAQLTEQSLNAEPIDAAAPIDGGSWMQKPCEWMIGSGCYGTITWYAKADGSTPVPKFCTEHQQSTQQVSDDQARCDQAMDHQYNEAATQGFPEQ